MYKGELTSADCDCTNACAAAGRRGGTSLIGPGECCLAWNSKENLKEQFRCLIGGVECPLPSPPALASAGDRNILMSSVAERDSSFGIGGALDATGADATDSLLDALAGAPRDFDRALEPPIMLLRNPRTPRSRSTSDSASEDAEDVGRESSSTTGERVVCRFQATLGLAKAVVLGGTSPSNARNEPPEGTAVSVRMIRSRRPGAGLQGMVEGAAIAPRPAACLSHTYCDQTERSR